MKIHNYKNYEEYRNEASLRPPKTLEEHQQRLAKTIEVLYQQNDYRSLDVIFQLSKALESDENYDMCFLMRDTIIAIPKMDSTLRDVLRGITKGL